jgi:hypothetical protein
MFNEEDNYRDIKEVVTMRNFFIIIHHLLSVHSYVHIHAHSPRTLNTQISILHGLSFDFCSFFFVAPFFIELSPTLCSLYDYLCFCCFWFREPFEK